MGLRTKEPRPVDSAELQSSDLERLHATFRGQLVLPTDQAYDQVRQVPNAMVDHRPALFCRCLGVADVSAAIGFAQERELDVAVRGGGHSVVGHSVADGAVVVDLSLMRGVEIDARRRVARVQGGAWIADLDREAQHVGLATTGGLVPDTGVGGLTLGGGYGWLARRHGLACDNLLRAELVLADGSAVTASPTENRDLFWAIRGGGGNFGVVTAFEFRLHPLDHPVASGEAYYRQSDGAAALRAFRELLDAAPDDLTLWAWSGIGSDEVPVPAECHGRPVIGVGWVWTGEDPAEGRRLGEPLHAAGAPVAEPVTTMSYVALQSGPAGLDRPRRRVYWKASFLGALSDATLAAFLEGPAAANDGAALAFGEMIALGGAIGRRDESEAAYSHRSALVDFLGVASWTDAGEDAARMSAARSIWETVADTGEVGVYVNNLGAEGPDRVRAAYGPAKLDRLVAIKRRYDPSNVFRHNQNIVP
ncbi:MAG: FAD-binding oxidoreductase [Candidatus Limnocylindria bacterium]